MQLVLDDEVGRGERRGEARALAWFGGPVEARRVVPVDAAQKCPRLSYPWERSELVHRRDQKGREAPIDGLVHGDDRQCTVAREIALEIRAHDAQLARLVVIRQQREGVGPEARSAPWAVLE